MRTITKTIELYKFNEASPELKAKIRDYFNYSYNLYEYNMQERIESLKAFANKFSLELDYSISCVPDRSEFIRFKTKNESRTIQELVNEINAFNTSDKDCPFTGVCYDHDVLSALYNLSVYNIYDKLEALYRSYLESIHNEYESMLQDDYLNDLCEANDYEFTIDGNLY